MASSPGCSQHSAVREEQECLVSNISMMYIACRETEEIFVTHNLNKELNVKALCHDIQLNYYKKWVQEVAMVHVK